MPTSTAAAAATAAAARTSSTGCSAAVRPARSRTPIAAAPSSAPARVTTDASAPAERRKLQNTNAGEKSPAFCFYGRRSEPIIQSEAHDIVGHAAGFGDRADAGKTVSRMDIAGVHVEIFGAHPPVCIDRRFDAAAEHPGHALVGFRRGEAAQRRGQRLRVLELAIA